MAAGATAVAAYPAVSVYSGSQRLRRRCISPAVGGEIVTERTPDGGYDDEPGDEPGDKDSAASSADQAKEREREMEESGEENAG
jgi:hypothetical protein